MDSTLRYKRYLKIMKTDLDGKLNTIFEKALQCGVNQKELKKLAKIKTPPNGRLAVKYDKRPFNIKYTLLVTSLVVGLFSAGLPNEAFHEPITYMIDLFATHLNESCLLHPSYLTIDLLRPVDSCGMCRNVSEVSISILVYE